jgi:hypothetical protein
MYLIDDIQKLADYIRKENNINKSFSFMVFRRIMILFNNECVDYEVLVMTLKLTIILFDEQVHNFLIILTL